MVHFRQLTIIGVGLIGGSLARALRQAGVVDRIVGSSRRTEHLQKAVDLGVIDAFDTRPEAAVKGADCVIVAVPLGAMQRVFESIAPHLEADAVVTDVGSSKGSVLKAVEAACGGIPSWFVPGHPIAGAEKSGVSASFAELYQGRRVILTPTPQTAEIAHQRVKAMWQIAGAEVVDMEVRHHDEVLAATSHLPHILAYGLVDTLAGMEDKPEIFRYAAGGFRDFTRIASSDPVMWRDICLNNREAILAVLDRYTRDIAELRSLIDASEGDALEALFSRAKRARDEFVG